MISLKRKGQSTHLAGATCLSPLGFGSELPGISGPWDVILFVGGGGEAPSICKEPPKNEKSEKSDDRKSDDKKEEHGSRESRRSSFASSAGASSSLSEGSGSEDFDVGLDMAPLEKVSFDFLTFAGFLGYSLVRLFTF